MSFNGSGVFNVNSAGQPVVASTLITSAAFNAFTADVATALSTCILKDGQQTVTANIPFGGNKLTGVAAGTARTDAANIGLLQDGTGVYVATVGGTVDVITLTPSPAITAYTAGMSFKFIAAGANTTNVTVNVSGLGAKAVTKTGSTALVGGDLPSGAIVHATYDGTRFQVQVGQATINASTLISNLVSYVHPDVNTAHRDSIKAGYIPAWFNQGWGGGINGYELVDAATGTPYVFESATGYIEQSGSTSFGAAAGNTWIYQGFKVSSTQSISAIWLKLSKTGNPANNAELRILPDDGSGTKPTGSTAITNGTATAISGKLFESGDTAGQWYRFVFPTPCALTANTFYYITLKSSGAVDASNYWNVCYTTTPKYPHGNLGFGDATPTWSTNASDMCFLVEAPSTTQTFQTGGIFGDGKAVFYEGSPLNQSNQRRADLADLKGLTPNNMTLLLRGTAHTKDKTIADMTYGLDHDRVVVRCNITTGFPSLTVYDSAGTASTVTGTTDISSGNHDVAALVTTAGCSLWVDGASQGTPIVTTITFDKLFAQGQIGSLWIGGGFALAPTWTKKWSMGSLPSADGATYGGVATEANAFSVSGNALYQNKSGYTALQDGYYSKTTAAFSNANGWTIADLSRVASSTNTKDATGAALRVRDGTKDVYHARQEYYSQSSSLATNAYPQVDLKTSLNESNFSGKGSDCYAWLNGRLVMDGTGLMTTASATNQLDYGDLSVTSGENYDVEWKFVAYYNTAALLPQATAGSLSEWAIWTGDKTSILATLYNSGSPISVKQFCGIGPNWKRGGEGAWVHRIKQKGVSVQPTISVNSIANVEPEMEAFVIGADITGSINDTVMNSVSASQLYHYIATDGKISGVGEDVDILTAYGSGVWLTTNTRIGVTKVPKYFGPHKIEVRWGAQAGTQVSITQNRTLEIEGRS